MTASRLLTLLSFGALAGCLCLPSSAQALQAATPAPTAPTPESASPQAAPPTEAASPQAEPSPAPASPQAAPSPAPASPQAAPSPAPASPQAAPSPAPASPQAAPPPKPSPAAFLSDKTRRSTGWGLGVAAGTTSGIGLSTRRYFDNGLGVHIGAMYVYTEGWQWGNLGIEALYTLARGRKTRLYALVGTQLLFDSEGSGTVSGDSSASTLFFGPGLGVEIHFTKHFGWAIEMPLHAVIALDDNDIYGSRLALGGRVNLLPGANTAFTFYFK